MLSSRPAEAEAKLSFAAVAELLDGVLEGVLGGLPTPQQNDLQVALLLKDQVGSLRRNRAVCAVFLGVIRCLASRGPVVIAVDDLQWLDRPSAVTLDYALRRLMTEPVAPADSPAQEQLNLLTSWTATRFHEPARVKSPRPHRQLPEAGQITSATR